MAGTDAGRVPWRRAHVPSTRTGVPCSEPMSRRTRTGSIPCERGRWDELGEYVDHRRRDARRQLEDIKGSRTERIVRGAEPLAANLAPFRIGPAPPLYVGDCARDEPAPRTQLSVDSPGLLDGGEPAHGRVRGRAVPRRLLPLPLIRCRRLRQSGCARHATMCRLAASRLPVVPVTTATSASQTAARSGGAVAVIPAAAVAAGGRRPPPRRRWPRLRRHSAARRTGGGSTAVIPAAALGALDSVAAAASAWVRTACAGVSPSASGLLPRRPVVPVAGPRRHPGCFLGFGNCCCLSASGVSVAPSAAVGTAARYLAATPAERQWRLSGIHGVQLVDVGGTVGPCHSRRACSPAAAHSGSACSPSKLLTLAIPASPFSLGSHGSLTTWSFNAVVQIAKFDTPRPSYSECSRTASTAGWARTAPQRLDLRGLPATHRPQDDEAPAGRFRKDLLYRLNVFGREAPPLRDTCSSAVTVTVPDETGAEGAAGCVGYELAADLDSGHQRGSTGDDQITQDRGRWSIPAHAGYPARPAGTAADGSWLSAGAGSAACSVAVPDAAVVTAVGT